MIFHAFNFLSNVSIPYFVGDGAGHKTASTGGRLSSDQENSAFRLFSSLSWHACLLAAFVKPTFQFLSLR